MIVGRKRRVLTPHGRLIDSCSLLLHVLPNLPLTRAFSGYFAFIHEKDKENLCSLLYRDT